MLKRYNRLYVALHVIADFLAAIGAFALAYIIRFNSGLMAVTQPPPPFGRYLALAPAVGAALAFVFLGEPVTARKIAGIGAVLVGILLLAGGKAATGGS